MVPHTAVVTARFFPIPRRIAIGYDTSVCDPNIEASRFVACSEYTSIRTTPSPIN
jgi:hypothetical protein